jgi:beta-phosphoglucomutase
LSLAVLFDVDGVLVDSYRPHFESWVRLYQELGYEYSEDEFRAGFGRTSAENLEEWARMNGQDWDRERIEQLDDRKEALYRDAIRENLVPIDGASELIESLFANGFRLGIGSSGPPENVQVVVDRLPGAVHFTAIVSRADVVRGKPDPEVFLVGAQRLGVEPHACAVIEDAVPGIHAANAAGMVSVGLVGTTTRDKLAIADLVIDSLRALSAHVIEELIQQNVAANS